ncbi:cysteine-rich RLK (RECEPTOR-like protein kinase) 8 [Hibiscus trionum]|uniref:Cysteine-rich RLK (RECEPTOR-like protein kinase) 8 n=1 Tax=Hibiscus trionum TaxID=183268 RepID=A0A9W7H398_HIBTR|nr:cysteine-rich RLK (RECEPTOR-like protein kinase) 8 [Hibiscus trionum]
MKLPQGYLPESSNSNLVCKLQKSIYGLKQASRQWFNAFSKVVLQYGFHQSQSDHSLFVHGSDDNMIVLLVYVDDIILAGKNVEHLQDVQAFLHKHFKLKDLGPLKYFLGFEIARNSSGISLSQRKYALNLLEDTDTLASKPADTPITASHKLSLHDGELLQDP